MTMPRRGPTTPGAALRAAGIECLVALESGGFSQPLIEKYGRSFEPRDQRMLRQLVMLVLRNRSLLDLQISTCVTRPVHRLDPGVRNALRLGACQLTLTDRIPEHAAISSTVQGFKERYGLKATRFVNGVLRSLQRAHRAKNLPQGLTLDEQYSIPRWIFEDWNTRLGSLECESLCQFVNQPAPLIVRPHKCGDLSDLESALLDEEASVSRRQYAQYALEMKHSTPFALDSFHRGDWVVQDEASQMVVELLDPKAGERVWDMCAAPGGKTSLIDWLTAHQAEILATDLSARKATQLRQRLEQSPSITVHEADAATFCPDEPYDKILLDAPCSALGILRRHPELKWRRSPEDLKSCAHLQSSLLDNAARHLVIGGTLVYAVCSTFAEEGTSQVAKFLSRHPQFALAPPNRQELRWAELWQDEGVQLWPHRHQTDGFFLSRFIRKE